MVYLKIFENNLIRNRLKPIQHEQIMKITNAVGFNGRQNKLRTEIVQDLLIPIVTRTTRLNNTNLSCAQEYWLAQD